MESGREVEQFCPGEPLIQVELLWQDPDTAFDFDRRCPGVELPDSGGSLRRAEEAPGDDPRFPEVVLGPVRLVVVSVARASLPSNLSWLSVNRFRACSPKASCSHL